VVVVSYLLYKQGLKQLFRRKIIEQSKRSSHSAYFFFMLAGLLLGSFFCFYIFKQWTPQLKLELQILLTTGVSILIGELMYWRNNHMIQQIIVVQGKSHEVTKEKD
jgi:hypothetical protein